MAPQNFNPWSLTFDHVLFDDSQVAITTNNYVCTVSDRGLKFCGAISGRAIFLYQLFLFCIKTIKHHQVTKAVSSTHFWVFVKISLLLLIILSPDALP